MYCWILHVEGRVLFKPGVLFNVSTSLETSLWFKSYIWSCLHKGRTV